MLARVEVVTVVTGVMSVGRECFHPIFCLARWPSLHSVDDASDECHFFFFMGPGCHSGGKQWVSRWGWVRGMGGGGASGLAVSRDWVAGGVRFVGWGD
ncbi:hypothetical protein Hanom_Chr14g01294701 [Helianthus anomalus]